MALAQIIDLGEARARRAAKTHPAPVAMMGPANDAMVPLWCYVWMPMYWYVA